VVTRVCSLVGLFVRSFVLRIVMSQESSVSLIFMQFGTDVQSASLPNFTRLLTLER